MRVSLSTVPAPSRPRGNQSIFLCGRMLFQYHNSFGPPIKPEFAISMSYTLPEFLAHAVAMEQEAADRYHELADMMEAHHNNAVSGVFRDMCRYSEMHRDSIVKRAGTIELPK